MIDSIFAICVILLEWLGSILGISYQAINVWIFCVAWPLFTVWLIILVLRYRKKLKTSELQNEELCCKLAQAEKEIYHLSP